MHYPWGLAGLPNTEVDSLICVQLQDVHKWSFGRPDPKANKNIDEGSAEDIPLEGLDNGLPTQDSNGSHDRWASFSCI